MGDPLHHQPQAVVPQGDGAGETEVVVRDAVGHGGQKNGVHLPVQGLGNVGGDQVIGAQAQVGAVIFNAAHGDDRRIVVFEIGFGLFPGHVFQSHSSASFCYPSFLL